MSQIAASAPPLLLHLQFPADPGLVAVLRHCAPDARVESAAFRLEDWLRLHLDPQLEGIVLDVEDLALADLRLILASLQREPRPWLLALAGDRGVVGCEGLLSAPRSAILPKPWTPAGLEACLRTLRARPATKAGVASDAFLAGLVEGLRDPLSSLGGVLQLLEQQPSAGSGEWLRPALEATRSLERQIECLYLASAPLRPRPELLDLRPIAAEALASARRADARTEADLSSGNLTVAADPRFLLAALDVGRLLLTRFGPGGALRLRALADADGVRLGWECSPPVALVAGLPTVTAPPPFLPELFERLAQRVPARALLDRLHGAVPVAAGLRWMPQAGGPA